MEEWQSKSQGLRTCPIASIPLRAMLDYGAFLHSDFPQNNCIVAYFFNFFFGVYDYIKKIEIWELNPML